MEAKLRAIVQDNRMSARPEYYSGRGATLTDLNAKILSGIHKGIGKDFGKGAAKNFVKMVADIKVLSATTFLQELEMLEYNDWKYTEKESHANGISIPKNKDGEYDEQSMMSGMIGLIGAMTNTRDNTSAIRTGFLRANGIGQKDGHGERDQYGNEYVYYG